MMSTNPVEVLNSADSSNFCGSIGGSGNDSSRDVAFDSSIAAVLRTECHGEFAPAARPDTSSVTEAEAAAASQSFASVQQYFASFGSSLEDQCGLGSADVVFGSDAAVNDNNSMLVQVQSETGGDVRYVRLAPASHTIDYKPAVERIGEPQATQQTSAEIERSIKEFMESLTGGGSVGSTDFAPLISHTSDSDVIYVDVNACASVNVSSSCMQQEGFLTDPSDGQRLSTAASAKTNNTLFVTPTKTSNFAATKSKPSLTSLHLSPVSPVSPNDTATSSQPIANETQYFVPASSLQALNTTLAGHSQDAQASTATASASKAAAMPMLIALVPTILPDGTIEFKLPFMDQQTQFVSQQPQLPGLSQAQQIILQSPNQCQAATNSQQQQQPNILNLNNLSQPLLLMLPQQCSSSTNPPLVQLNASNSAQPSFQFVSAPSPAKNSNKKQLKKIASARSAGAASNSHTSASLKFLEEVTRRTGVAPTKPTETGLTTIFDLLKSAENLAGGTTVIPIPKGVAQQLAKSSNDSMRIAGGSSETKPSAALTSENNRASQDALGFGEELPPKKKRPKKSDDPNAPPPKRGRPKGALNAKPKENKNKPKRDLNDLNFVSIAAYPLGPKADGSEQVGDEMFEPNAFNLDAIIKEEAAKIASQDIRQTITIVGPDGGTEEFDLRMLEDETVVGDDGAIVIPLTEKRKKVRKPDSEPRPTFKCLQCDFTCKRKKQISQHLEEAHGQVRMHKCGICERLFKSNSALQNHLNTHFGKKPHICGVNECKMAFTTTGELARHRRYKHSHDKPHKCDYCDYRCVERGKLQRHVRSHTNERPYECKMEGCGYRSVDTYKLKRHMRIHTGEKPYECDVCLQRFTQSNSMKAHKLVHQTNRNSYHCPQCSSVLAREADLKSHIRKQHLPAAKPFDCLRCEQTFASRYELKCHSVVHVGEHAHSCELCGYATSSRRRLKSHLLIHTDYKPHICEFEGCDGAFRSATQLRRHFNLKHNPEYVEPPARAKEFACERCETHFRYEKNLDRHLRHHAEEDRLQAEEAALPPEEAAARQKQRADAKLQRRLARNRKFLANFEPGGNDENDEDDGEGSESEFESGSESSDDEEEDAHMPVERATVRTLTMTLRDSKRGLAVDSKPNFSSQHLSADDAAEFIPNFQMIDALAHDGSRQNVSSSLDETIEQIIGMDGSLIETRPVRQMLPALTHDVISLATSLGFAAADASGQMELPIPPAADPGAAVADTKSSVKSPRKRLKHRKMKLTRIKRVGRPAKNVEFVRHFRLPHVEDARANEKRDLDLAKEVEDNFGFSEVVQKLSEQRAKEPSDPSCSGVAASALKNGSGQRTAACSSTLDVDLAETENDLCAEFADFPHFPGDKLRAAHKFRLDTDAEEDTSLALFESSYDRTISSDNSD